MITALLILGLVGQQQAQKASGDWLNDALKRARQESKSTYDWRPQTGTAQRVVRADGSLLFTVWENGVVRRMTDEEIRERTAREDALSKKIEEGRQFLIARDLPRARHVLTEVMVEEQGNYLAAMLLAIAVLLDDKYQEALALLAPYDSVYLQTGGQGANVIAYVLSQGSTSTEVAAYSEQSLRSMTKGLSDDIPDLARSQKALSAIALGRSLEGYVGRDVAVTFFEKAIQDDPTNPLANYYVGKTALLRRQYAKAVSHLQAAQTYGGQQLKASAASDLGYAKWRLQLSGGG